MHSALHHMLYRACFSIARRPLTSKEVLVFYSRKFMTRVFPLTRPVLTSRKVTFVILFNFVPLNTIKNNIMS